MILYKWDWSVVSGNLPVFIGGVANTLLLTLVSCLLGIALGVLLAAVRLSRLRILRVISAVLIEIFLALPVLVLMIWLYYCLPLVLKGSELSAFSAAVLALSLSLSAFVAEIVGTGIRGVPVNQSEVAWTLGLSRIQVLRIIVLPQAIRSMVPPLMGQIITCWKLSSLASVIAVYELLHSAENLISQTFRPLEIYSAVAVMYFVSILPANLLSRRLVARGKTIATIA